MIQATVHGFQWVLGYWLLVCLAGLVLGVSNIRYVLTEGRTIQAGETDEKPMRASSLGYLIVHVAVALVGVSVLLLGLDLQVGAFKRSGLVFIFANVESEVIVVGLALLVPTVPAGIAAGLWLQRWWTVRALNTSKEKT